jgi:hypothetical protein
VWAGLALLVASSTLVIYFTGHGTSFVRDEWNLILTRRGHSLEAFLRPHNLHLMALQVLVYKGLLQVVGLTSYAPYRAVSVALHALVTVLLFVFARRRIGPVGALGIAAVFAFPGVSGDEVLWAFQIHFLSSVAAGLGMLLMLERGDRRGDLVASGLLLVALASSGVGLGFAFAASVEVALGPDRLRRFARVLAVPIGLYGIWYLTYGGPVPRNLLPATEVPGARPANLFDNFLHAPLYTFDAAGGALAALLGVDFQFGPPLVVAAVALLGVRLLRGAPPSPRLWVLLALLVGYWILLALARAQFNDYLAPRYLYPAAAYILLVGVEAARAVPLVSRARWLLMAGAAVVVVSNIGLLRGEADGFRLLGNKVLPRLTALEVARGRVDPSFRPFPDATGAAPDIVAGPYFAAVDAFGSPAPTVTDLARRPDLERVWADATLVQALAVRPVVAPAPPAGGGPAVGAAPAVRAAPASRAGLASGPGWAVGPAPPIVGARGGPATVQAGCAVLEPDALGAWIEVRVPPSGLLLGSSPGGPILLRARRLAAGFGDPFAAIPGGREGAIRFPPDRLPLSWYLRIDSAQEVRACDVSS